MNYHDNMKDFRSENKRSTMLSWAIIVVCAMIPVLPVIFK